MNLSGLIPVACYAIAMIVFSIWWVIKTRGEK